MKNWFDSTDKVICTLIMALYIVKVYVSQHRTNEILSVESLLNLIVFLPVMLIPLEEMSMLNKYFVFLSISRFFRAVFFCVVMIKFYELGASEVDRQIKVIIMTLVLIIIVQSGLFADIENSYNLVAIEEDGTMIFKDGFSIIQFHDALYFVVVTLFTVGYGDINAD